MFIINIVSIPVCLLIQFFEILYLFPIEILYVDKKLNDDTQSVNN